MKKIQAKKISTGTMVEFPAEVWAKMEGNTVEINGKEYDHYGHVELIETETVQPVKKETEAVQPVKKETEAVQPVSDFADVLAAIEKGEIAAVKAGRLYAFIDAYKLEVLNSRNLKLAVLFEETIKAYKTTQKA